MTESRKDLRNVSYQKEAIHMNLGQNNYRKNFYISDRIRQCICVILSICTAAILTGVLVERRMEIVDAKMSETQETLAKEVFRFHVLANSDSEEDQAVKLKVRDAVIDYMRESMDSELQEEPDAVQTKAWAKRHLGELKQVADQVVRDEGYAYSSEAEVAVCYFPDKLYGDIFFPQGDYEALRIRLGAARGQNWWCVLYPNLCFTGSTCAVVTDEGKEDLKSALTAEEYEMVTAAADFKIKWFFFGDDED
jgi:stage II sporulation protein R